MTDNPDTPDRALAMTVHHEPARPTTADLVLMHPASTREIVDQQAAISRVIAEALVVTVDYGMLPGTNRNTLFKPGAEKITKAFRCVTVYRILESEVEHLASFEYVTRKGKRGVSYGRYRYVIQCDLLHLASGVVVGTGIGSCSSLESKYIATPRDAENTILKMAQKRAHVSATLNAFALSGSFTQDLEEPRQGLEADDEVAAVAPVVAQPADAEPQPDPADVLIPAGSNAGQRIGDLSLVQLQHFRASFESNQKLVARYPIFYAAVLAHEAELRQASDL